MTSLPTSAADEDWTTPLLEMFYKAVRENKFSDFQLALEASEAQQTDDTPIGTITNMGRVDRNPKEEALSELRTQIEARRTQWEATRKKWENKRFQEWQKGHIEGHLEENAEIQKLIDSAETAKKGVN